MCALPPSCSLLDNDERKFDGTTWYYEKSTEQLDRDDFRKSESEKVPNVLHNHENEAAARPLWSFHGVEQTKHDPRVFAALGPVPLPSPGAKEDSPNTFNGL